MNLTTSIAAMLALHTSQIWTGTFNVPIGFHTVDMNTLTVNACTAAGSNPNMAHTLDANFTLLGDPGGGSYIKPTATPSSYMVMFQVNGGRVKCKDIRFNGDPTVGSNPVGTVNYWIAFQLNGNKAGVATTGRPDTRTFLLEDCEFRHCARAIVAYNYENIRLENNRFEITRQPDVPPNPYPAEGPASIWVEVKNGSQNFWARNSDMWGNGYSFTDTFDEGTSAPSKGRFFWKENLINAYNFSFNILRGQCYLFNGCLIDSLGVLGPGINVSAASGHTVNGVSVCGSWTGANTNYKQVYSNAFEIAICGNQIIGNAQQTGITLENAQQVMIVGNTINMPSPGAIDVYADAATNGVRFGVNTSGAPGAISDSGTHNWWQNNRIEGSYTATGGATNSYQTAPTG